MSLLKYSIALISFGQIVSSQGVILGERGLAAEDDSEWITSTEVGNMYHIVDETRQVAKFDGDIIKYFLLILKELASIITDPAGSGKRCKVCRVVMVVAQVAFTNGKPISDVLRIACGYFVPPFSFICDLIVKNHAEDITKNAANQTGHFCEVIHVCSRK